METVTTLPRDRSLTRADLEQVPDDGHRYELIDGTLDVALADDPVLQPDLLVARRGDFTDRDLPVAPLLAVEVLSPSTRLIDADLVRARYQAAGCPSYWVVEPDEPSLTAWELEGGKHLERAHVTAAEIFTAEAPFAVSLTPARLVD